MLVSRSHRVAAFPSSQHSLNELSGSENFQQSPQNQMSQRSAVSLCSHSRRDSRISARRPVATLSYATSKRAKQTSQREPDRRKVARTPVSRCSRSISERPVQGTESDSRPGDGYSVARSRPNGRSSRRGSHETNCATGVARPHRSGTARYPFSTCSARPRCSR